jgi:hypothetical protein
MSDFITKKGRPNGRLFSVIRDNFANLFVRDYIRARCKELEGLLAL